MASFLREWTVQRYESMTDQVVNNLRGEKGMKREIRVAGKKSLELGGTTRKAY